MTSWAEVWKDIPGYEGRYQASNLGRIRSVNHEVTRVIKGRVLRPRIRKEGYPIVTLSGAGPKDIHALVALAFHGPRKEGQQVRHLDGNPENNRADNLAYGTQSENERDKYRYGDKRNKLTVDDVREIRKLLAQGTMTNGEIGALFGVSDATISQIKRRETFAWVQ